MKKFLALFLCAAAALSLTACSADKESFNSESGVSSEESVSSGESVTVSSEESDVSSEETVSSDSSVSSNESSSPEESNSPEERTEYKSLTVLGDSIASGCMLPQYEAGNNYSAPASFGNMLGAGFESYHNFAVDGRTTEGLLNALETSDEELSEDVSSSNVIVISIGGNDFLQPMLSAMMNDSELIASMFTEGFQPDMADEYAQKVINSALEAAKNVDVKKTLDNISKCVELISDVNPNAEIILMTVYDPFSGNELLKEASEVAQEQLSLLNFGLTMLQGEKVSVIDVYGEFDGKADKYTNIGFMDIHPNADGHYRIYELLKKQLGIDD
ncbi:MAG: SGNH/GDSL hydrolase family protein [Lachnospiraceae bacterium]|nr:SGNH/GDSL hydrolase family protein [Ruminococcus sp.]MCM1275900.1 SGNH/GDSL hydrolase family protein [Lachnospiraceae bacterium]